MPVTPLPRLRKTSLASALGAVLFAAACALTIKPAQAETQDSPGAFDFYVLSLSWSPTYCSTPNGRTNRLQCSPAKRLGMILHGLWPQNERGYPESCPTTEPTRVDETLGRRYFDIMPGMSLIGHEWRKHGTCSGLTQSEYFATARRAFEQIRMPDQMKNATKGQRYTPDVVEQLFIKDNPGLTKRGIAVTCQGEMLEEVRICLTKDLQFRDCPQVDADQCRRSFVSLPPAP